MPVPVIAAGIGGLSSVLGSVLSGKPKTTTTTMTPTWSPEMQGLESQLSNYSSGLMSDPSAGLSPIKTASQDAINRRYAAIPGKVSSSMAARGYGSSGNFGNTMYQTEFAREGDMSNLDSQIAQMMLAQKNQGASLSEQLLGMTRGTTTTGTTPNTSAADGFMSAGNGLSNLSTIMMLNNILKPGGGGGSSNSII